MSDIIANLDYKTQGICLAASHMSELRVLLAELMTHTNESDDLQPRVKLYAMRELMHLDVYIRMFMRNKEWPQ